MVNIIKNAKVFGNIRRTAWLHDRMIKGFFTFCDKGDTVKATLYANQLDEMITLLNGTMGENWDFDIRPYFREEEVYVEDPDDPEYSYYDDREVFKGFHLYLVLRYPEVEMTNSNNDRHTIKDLFVTFKILESELSGNSLYLDRPKGTRAFQTYEEWFSGFHHSHLHANQCDSYRNALWLDSFCLGSNEVVHQLNSLTEEWSSEMFELLMLTMNTMIGWESIEGTPYTYMSKIGSGLEIDTNSDTHNSYMRERYDELRPRILEFDVNFYFDGKMYKIKTDHKFERFLHAIVVEYMADRWDKMLVTRRGTKTYGYKHPQNATKEELRKKFSKNGDGVTLPHFYFRNNKVEFNVEPYQGELPSVENYKVNPKFIKYASDKLEQELYYNAVRKYSFEREDQSRDAEEDTSSDQVLVSSDSESGMVGNPAI